MKETCSYTIVDSVTAIIKLLDKLCDLSTNPPSLFVDLEGVNLSRHGTVSILQLYVRPEGQTYLLDISLLKDSAFLTSRADGKTLKSILEARDIPKVFFDLRNDSDALFSQFGISLAGVQDLQLMELGSRKGSKRCVNGLAKCIQNDAPLTIGETSAWKSTKEKGLKIFAPEHGGSYEVFNTRPLPHDIIQYCVQDVEILPKLWSLYNSKLSRQWAKKADEATIERVNLSQTLTYNGQGRHMALGPW